MPTYVDASCASNFKIKGNVCKYDHTVPFQASYNHAEETADNMVNSKTKRNFGIGMADFECSHFLRHRGADIVASAP